jgi:hypothetical protein
MAIKVEPAWHVVASVERNAATGMLLVKHIDGTSTAAPDTPLNRQTLGVDRFVEHGGSVDESDEA